VDLERRALGPGAAELGERQRRVKHQRAAGTRPRLCQLLGRHPAEREAGVDELGRQVLRRSDAVVEERAESDLAGVCNSLLDRVKGLSVVEIWRVHGVPG
jgi:hypothetical protein